MSSRQRRRQSPEAPSEATATPVQQAPTPAELDTQPFSDTPLLDELGLEREAFSNRPHSHRNVSYTTAGATPGWSVEEGADGGPGTLDFGVSRRPGAGSAFEDARVARDEVDATHGWEAQQARAEVRDSRQTVGLTGRRVDGTGTTEATATIGHDADGFRGGVSLQRQTEGADVSSAMEGSTTGSLTYENGHGQASLQTARGGVENTTSIRSDGRVQHSRQSDRTMEDGRTQRTTVQGNVNALEGQVGAGATLAIRDGRRQVASVGANGSVDMSSDGQIEGASAGVSASMGPVSASAGARFNASTGDIQENPNGGFDVSYNHLVGGGAGAGLGATQGGGSTLNAGVNLGADHAGIQRGSLHFDTREEAEAFKRRAQTHLDSYVADTSTAAGALEMQEGESQSIGSVDTLSGGASVGYLGVSAGLNASDQDSDEVTVTRGPGSTVDVRTHHGNLDRMGGTFGGLGVRMGGGSRDREGHDSVVRFDLSTEEGQRAYEAYQSTGRLEEGGTGYQQLYDDRVEAEGNEVSVGLLGLEAGRNSEVAHHDRVVNGQRQQIVRGEMNDNVSAFGSSGSQSSHFEAVQYELGGEEVRRYRIGAEAQGSTGEATSLALAEATGTSPTFGDDIETSGQYRVEAEMSPEEVDRFSRAVLSGDAHTAILLSYSDDGDALREALSAAGTDVDARNEAIAAFISEAGLDGLDWMRSAAGADGEFDIALEGDRYLWGAEGRISLEGRIERYEGQALADGTDAMTLQTHLAGELNGLRYRLDALRNQDRYRDLPDGLREQEVERTLAWITRLTSLQGAQEGVSTGDPRIDSLNAQSTAMRARVDRLEALVRSSQDGANQSRDVQLNGRGAWGGRSAQDRWGAQPEGLESMWGLIGEDGPETQGYARAETLYREAEALMRSARSQRFVADQSMVGMAAEGGMDPYRSAQASFNAGAAEMQATIRMLEQAKALMDSAEGQYQAIRQNHEGEGTGAFNGYHPGR